MVDDHVHTDSRLADMVNSLSVNVPNDPGPKDAKLILALERMQGEAFDRRFIQEQISDHRDDIEKFSEEIKTTHSPEIRRYAIETRPILEQHLALAEAVAASLPGGGQQQSR